MPGGLIVLASQSPRRGQLLAEAGYRFVQMRPPFDDPPAPEETILGSESASRVVRLLAQEKARSLLPVIDEASLDATEGEPVVVVAADTLVVDNRGRVMGQPQSKSEAQKMLSRLMSGPHEVVTGVAMIDLDNTEHCLSFCDITLVYLGDLLNDVVHAYVDSGRWQGKAGGYNLAELDADWPFEVRGDRTTVIGLPMLALAKRLADWGVTGDDNNEKTTDPAEAVQP